MENPWNIQTIYELQYFNCPSCIFKNHSKQKFINHAYNIHPESIEYLKNIDDKSLVDLLLPWNIAENKIINAKQNDELNLEINEEFEENSDALKIGKIKTETYDLIVGDQIENNNILKQATETVKCDVQIVFQVSIFTKKL